MNPKIEYVKWLVKSFFGDGYSAHLLGSYHYWGLSGITDVPKAYRYYKLAAERGQEISRRIMEDSFEIENGNPVIPASKKEFYPQARELMLEIHNGNPREIYFYYSKRLKDKSNPDAYKRAVRMMQWAADQDCELAAYDLAVEYINSDSPSWQKAGKRIMNKLCLNRNDLALTYCLRTSPESVMDIVMKLVEERDPEGCQILADYYNYGWGGERDLQKAINLYEIAAEQNHATSILHLAITYEHGDGPIGKDIKKAVSLYEKAVGQNHALAMKQLGDILMYSEEYPQDEKRAFELYVKSAALEYAPAYLRVAECYMDGKGAEKNEDVAIENYRIAATEGLEEAFIELALYYLRAKEYEEAIKWIKKGMSKGIGLCYYYFAELYRRGLGVDKDDSIAFQYYEIAAKKEVPPAYEKVAFCYQQGIGCKENPSEAYEWYVKAADYSVNAITSLAQCYIYGYGVQRDFQKAVELLETAVEEGDAQAMLDLGICYRTGEGVEVSIPKAIELYSMAIEKGHPGAMVNLGVLYDNAIGVEENLELACKYFKMAAEAGYDDGQFCYGKMLFNGRGVEKNPAEAVKWFTLAAEQGEPDSMYHLSYCYYNGIGVEVDHDKSYDYLKRSAKLGFQDAINALKEMTTIVPTY